MTKPISKNDYSRFLKASGFSINQNKGLSTFSVGFIKVFAECRRLVSKVHVERIKYLAKHGGEADAREYVESELINGMGDDND